MPVRFDWADESDQCYYPIPLDAPIEPGDKHVIVIDRDRWVLFELYGARLAGDRWQARLGGGVRSDFDMWRGRQAGLRRTRPACRCFPD